MKDINAIHIIGAIFKYSEDIENISRRFIMCLFDFVSRPEEDLPNFSELNEFISNNTNTSNLVEIIEKTYYHINKEYRALRLRFKEEFESLTKEQQGLLSDVVEIEFQRRFNDNIIGYDFQGWPVRRLSLKDVLLSLGAKEHDGFIGFELSDELLSKFPITLEDDGMGYGVNKQYIVEANKDDMILFLDSSDVEL